MNGAAPGLGRQRLSGNELVRLAGIHPTRADVTFNLPGDRPQLWIEPPGCPAIEVESLLETISLEPDEDRLTLVWSGRLEVACRYPAAELGLVRHRVVWPLPEPPGSRVDHLSDAS
jgi:hypothetical protein